MSKLHAIHLILKPDKYGNSKHIYVILDKDGARVDVVRSDNGLDYTDWKCRANERTCIEVTPEEFKAWNELATQYAREKERVK